MDVTTCLRSQLSEKVPETCPVPVMMGMMAALGVATMSTSQVVWDEATGATYLDTVTTSIGREALSVPEDEVIVSGPKSKMLQTSYRAQVNNHNRVAR